MYNIKWGIKDKTVGIREDVTGIIGPNEGKGIQMEEGEALPCNCRLYALYSTQVHFYKSRI